MARAIDSEVAFRFLTEQLVKETGAFSKGVNKGLNIARSAMRNPDAIPTLTPPNEWVSVEEGLPPDMGDVLVVAFWHERWQTMIGWCSDNGKKWRVYTSHGEREPGGVTHWMPLPVPPDRRPPEGEEDT